MNERPSVLFGPEDESAVLQIHRIDPNTVRIVMEMTSPEGDCPGWGFSSRGARNGSWSGSRTCRPRDRPLNCGGSSGAQCVAKHIAQQRRTTTFILQGVRYTRRPNAP